MRYKLQVMKIEQATEEELKERRIRNINTYSSILRESESAINILDVELTEEQWNKVRLAVIKEV